MNSSLQAATDAAQLSRLRPHASVGVRQRRWVIAGLVLGLLAALVWQAPAVWLARWLASSSQGHVLVVESRGTVWNGSGELVLTGGAGSRDASRLPGRVHWQLGWSAGSPELRLRLDCCSAGELPLKLEPGLSRLRISLPTRAEPLLRLPAAWLGGLGTPWNTLQLGGQLRLASRDFQLEWNAGRWLTRGQLDIEFANLSSRLSTLSPLGSYRLSVQSQQDGLAQLQLTTLDGALQLQGQGTVGGGAKSRFQGEARAAAGRESALNNLLNIIGRRQGERSVITIG
jgi:general secretion pathway protein N